MSKLKKVTYCQSCGQSNPWVMEAKSSLLQKPKFCTSCGINLSTGQKPAAPIKEVAAEIEVEEEEILNLVFHAVALEILYKKDNYYMVSQLFFHNLKVEKI